MAIAACPDGDMLFETCVLTKCINHEQFIKRQCVKKMQLVATVVEIFYDTVVSKIA